MLKIKEKRILLVRHAIAEDREVFSQNNKEDDLRPLTDKGRDKLSRSLKGLKFIFPETNAIFFSPTKRTKQTAEIIINYWKCDKSETAEALHYSVDPEETFAWLAQVMNKSNDQDKDFILVGHEPHLNLLATLCIGGYQAPFTLKKGGACLIKFKKNTKKGAGRLLGLLQPPLLLHLGQMMKGMKN